MPARLRTAPWRLRSNKADGAEGCSNPLRHGKRVRCWQIVLQKSFCGMGLKFSEAWARRLNNDVGTTSPHARFWQRVCGSIERRLSLVSFFGENLAAAAFGTFATLSARSGHQQDLFVSFAPILPPRQ